jgi:hypothetical protein
MAAPIKPQKKTANGKDTWWFVPTIAVKTAPTVTEINSASGLNFTCFLLAEQEGVVGNTAKATLARLLCETSTTEVMDETTWSMSDVQGVFDPQAAAAADGKKAWAKFKDGTTGYFVRRQGVANGTSADVSEDQFVDVIPVEVGPATPGKTATDASGIYSFTCAVSITDNPAFNVEVAAAA